MKGSGLFSVVAVLLLFFLSTASAWPWPESPNAVGGLVVARQETETPEETPDTETDEEAPAEETAAETAAVTDEGDEAAASETGDEEAAATSETGTRTTSTRTTPIDPRLPPGGIQLVTPAPIDGIQFYKVGDFVTFQWNYTSLSVTPSNIDVLASCALNSATYTIAANMSVEETGAVTWDTGDFHGTATNPFPVASYTLIVHDSLKDVTDIPSAGHLGAYAQYVFGMYTGQPYTPLNEFKCATCNGAMSLHEKQALGVLLMTCTITVLSFTWFASGFGVFS